MRVDAAHPRIALNRAKNWQIRTKRKRERERERALYSVCVRDTANSPSEQTLAKWIASKTKHDISVRNKQIQGNTNASTIHCLTCYQDGTTIYKGEKI